MEMLSPFFTFKSKSFSLNYSSSRTVQVRVVTIYPTIKIVVRLTAVDHRCHVDFSPTTWNKIIEEAEDIRDTMDSENERVIFENEEFRVFTEERHEQCAICFAQCEGSSRVNMMVKTFKNMVRKSCNIDSEYKSLYKKINETANKFKLFINTLSTQHNCCNAQNEEFNQFLTNLQQSANSLSQVNNNSLEVNWIFDESDSDEEYRYRRYRR